MSLENMKPEFEKLAKLDSRLWTLQKDAIAAAFEIGKIKDVFKRNPTKVFYDSFKKRVLALAGWERGCAPSELKTSEAYDVVYHHIHQLLYSFKYRMYVFGKRPFKK